MLMYIRTYTYETHVQDYKQAIGLGIGDDFGTYVGRHSAD